MAPGLIWLALFFVLPNIQMLGMSLSSGRIGNFEFSWDFSNFGTAITQFPDNFRNSLVYGGLATLLCMLVGYPLAYGIAFRGGRFKSLLLFLVIAPFFTSFLLRVISWRIIVGDRGPLLGVVRDTFGLLPEGFTIIGTPLAVTAGLTYQFLPFMVLPLYVSLEKVDRRYIEAAKDLYAGPWRPTGWIVGAGIGAAVTVALVMGLGYAGINAASLQTLALAIVIGGTIGALAGGVLVSESFVRVVFPLSLPGLFAGSVLVFIPAIGDFVNAELLGSTKTQMIGNVIQNRFLQQNDYPTAAALSFLLMAAILVAIFIYARVLGTEELTGGRPA
jgi:spermidine/putrescine transport system permease protein